MMDEELKKRVEELLYGGDVNGAVNLLLDQVQILMDMVAALVEKEITPEV